MTMTPTITIMTMRTKTTTTTTMMMTTDDDDRRRWQRRWRRWRRWQRRRRWWRWHRRLRWRWQRQWWWWWWWAHCSDRLPMHRASNLISDTINDWLTIIKVYIGLRKKNLPQLVGSLTVVTYVWRSITNRSVRDNAICVLASRCMTAYVIRRPTCWLGLPASINQGNPIQVGLNTRDSTAQCTHQQLQPDAVVTEQLRSICIRTRGEQGCFRQWKVKLEVKLLIYVNENSN